jgi:glucuronokinase
MPVFENLEDLYRTTRWRGYYGGIRLIQALVVRFMDYCRALEIPLPDRNFTVEYESSIPMRLGLGGSSAIITAALRALCEYFEVKIKPAIQAKLALETETKELGVPAGPQDRVIQAYEGLVYMEFPQHLMDKRGYGNYEPLDPALLHNVYVAYRTTLAEGTEVFHSNVRERWERRDKKVVDAMQTWAGYAERGRQALLDRDYETLGQLINANFDLRAKIYKISLGNLQMIETARRVGATANFAGSGGAIVGTYKNDRMYQDLRLAMQPLGVAVIKPVVTDDSGIFRKAGGACSPDRPLSP